jgi:phosphoglycolate phosphatase-like HAD superfamily hydrolase
VIKTILLDLDGPFLDGRFRHYQCYSDIISAYGYTPLPIEAYWAMKRSRKSRKEQLSCSGAEGIYDLFLDKWLKRIESLEYLQLDRVQDGALDQIISWSKAGMRLVVVTMRSSRTQLISQLESTGLLPYLDAVVDSRHTNGGCGKGMDLLREIPDIDPTTSLWVGDTEVDLEAARHILCPICLLSCGLRTKKYLGSLNPDFLYKMLTDINIGTLMNHGHSPP